MTDLLPDGWKLVKLADSMEAIIDYRGKTPKKTSAGIPLITARVVKGGRILDVEEYIAPDDFDSWMRRGLPQPGDVVITTEAPLGEVAQLDGRKVALAQRLITLRGKPGLLDNTFLKFLLRSEFVWEQIQGRGSGTTVIGIRQSELREIHLPIPPLPEQRAIARILGSLDDKIELNRRMNRTLEELAAAIFKSWFVDFDPVVARAEGRPPFGMDAATAALFPAAFEESEVGAAPVGWRVGAVGDIGRNLRLGVQPNQVDPSTPYIGLEHMPQRSIALTEWGSACDAVSGKMAFKRGDILFGKLRPYFHKVGVAPLDGVCSTDIVVVNAKRPEWFGILLGHLSSVEFVNFVDALSEGTRMPRTSWEDMARYQIVIPSPEIGSRFSELLNSLLAKMHAGIFESLTLAAIRDALLPKLMSGEIRVG